MRNSQLIIGMLAGVAIGLALSLIFPESGWLPGCVFFFGGVWGLFERGVKFGNKVMASLFSIAGLLLLDLAVLRHQGWQVPSYMSSKFLNLAIGVTIVFAFLFYLYKARAKHSS